jgi:hypothetical protein
MAGMVSWSDVSYPDEKVWIYSHVHFAGNSHGSLISKAAGNSNGYCEGAPKLPCQDEVLYPDTRNFQSRQAVAVPNTQRSKNPLGMGGISEDPFPMNSIRVHPHLHRQIKERPRWETRRDLRPDLRG